MKITKTYSKTYEVTPFPKAWDMQIGEFIEQRKEIGLPVKPFEKCFCCGHKFMENEIPTVALVSSKGNRFICNRCAEQAVKTGDS